MNANSITNEHQTNNIQKKECEVANNNVSIDDDFGIIEDFCDDNINPRSPVGI